MNRVGIYNEMDGKSLKKANLQSKRKGRIRRITTWRPSDELQNPATIIKDASIGKFEK